jgi:hypothetical protein
MGPHGQVHPQADAWIAAIHATQDDLEPKGSGIVLDELRILTCHHVVRNLEEKWVAFPKARGAASLIRRPVERVVLPDAYGDARDAFGDVRDLAILVLAEPVPAGVTAAALSFVEPAGLVGKRWWAFGFPADALGSAAAGQLGDALGYGWVRLLRESPDPVERGFSGGGLWCPDHQGVVGVVGQADGEPGGGRAITLHQADQWFPGQDLSSLAGRPTVPGQADVLSAAPEVVELARSLAMLPDALGIIHEVVDRTPAVAPPGASVLDLLVWIQELVQPRGEAHLLRQVIELAEQRATGLAQAAPTAASASGDSCLMVAMHQDRFDADNFLLSLTLFQDGEPGKPQPCGNPYGSLPELKKLVRELLPPILDSRRDIPMIEFAVPEKLLGTDFDQWPMRSRPLAPAAEDYRIGDRYPVVVRDLDRLDPGKVSVRDREMWESRWRLLVESDGPPYGLLREVELQDMANLRTSTAFSWLRATLWDAVSNAVLVLLPPSPAPASGTNAKTVKAVHEALRAGFAAGIPAAIWLRRPDARKHRETSAGTPDEDDRSYLENVLDHAAPGQPVPLRDLPRRVWSLRLQSEVGRRQASHQSRRLSLLWADPSRSLTPPEYHLPPRSSNGDDL